MVLMDYQIKVKNLEEIEYVQFNSVQDQLANNEPATNGLQIDIDIAA